MLSFLERIASLRSSPARKIAGPLNEFDHSVLLKKKKNILSNRSPGVDHRLSTPTGSTKSWDQASHAGPSPGLVRSDLENLVM